MYNLLYVVITKTGGQYQAKGFATIVEATIYQSWLLAETGVQSDIAKID
jgi:hypothetical protein